MNDLLLPAAGSPRRGYPTEAGLTKSAVEPTLAPMPAKPQDQLLSRQVPSHGSSPASLSFVTDPDARLAALRARAHQLKAADPAEPNQAAELAAIGSEYKALTLAHTDTLAARSHHNLGIEDFMVRLQTLSPELAAAAGGDLTKLKGLDLSQGLNFPLLRILAGSEPGALRRLETLLTAGAQARPVDQAQLALLSEFGLGLSEGRIVNAATGAVIDTATLAALKGLVAGAADAAGPMGLAGLPAFRALREVTTALATAIQAIGALREARQSLESETPKLEQARIQAARDQQSVRTLEDEVLNLEADGRRCEEDQASLALIEVVAAQSEGDSLPAAAGAWKGLLEREGIVVAEGGWQAVANGQRFETVSALGTWLRSRLQARRDGLLERLLTLRQRLQTAHQTLAVSMGRLDALARKVSDQQQRVAALKQQAAQSVAAVQTLLAQSGASLGGEFLALLQPFAAAVAQSYEREARAAEAACLAAERAGTAARRLLGASLERLATHLAAAVRLPDAGSAPDLPAPSRQAAAGLPGNEARRHFEAQQRELQACLQEFRQIERVRNDKASLESRLDLQFLLKLRMDLAHHQAELESLSQLRRLRAKALASGVAAVGSVS